MLELSKTKLERFNLSFDKLKNYDVLILPENFETAESESNLLETEHSISFGKVMKEKGVNAASSVDFGLSTSVLDRRSDDLWLGLIWVLNELAVPTFVRIAYDYIKENMTLPRVVKTKGHGNVHLELNLVKDDNITRLDYSGDSKTLLKILKTLNGQSQSKD